jgi:hypothetical protein
MVTLTSTGMAMASEVGDGLNELEAVVRELPEPDQGVLLQIVDHIERDLAGRGRVAVFGMCWQCQYFAPEAHPEDGSGPHHCNLMDVAVPTAETYKECPDFEPDEDTHQH